MGSLSGRVAIVTGAGSVAAGVGNGRAISILLARQGAKLGLIDLSGASAAETGQMVRAEGAESITVTADVSEAGPCEQAVAAIADALGSPSILVNNVGIVGARGNAVEVDPDQWDEVMRVNVKSIMLMSKYAVPHIKSAGGGSIVNMASIAGLRGGHPSLAYPTSKGAIVNMTRAMAYHHGPDGIRVNCVAPGLIHTPRIEARGGDAAVREARRRQSPLQTEGNAWDVAEAVLYLVSDAARWVTGQTLTIDAGLTAGTGSVGAH
jgi:NAD(P)-dependent dehydrogenase (short-subunit alcohol dehydrogenase family)